MKSYVLADKLILKIFEDDDLLVHALTHQLSGFERNNTIVHGCFANEKAEVSEDPERLLMQLTRRFSINYQTTRTST